MSLKGTQTACDYIEWKAATETADQLLSKPRTQTMGLYIIVSIYTGLRMSDVLTLTWEQLRSEKFTIKEMKTGKFREIDLNSSVLDAVAKCDTGKSGSVFISQKGQVFTKQQINRKLKAVFEVQTLKGLNISSHSLRKTFGRRIYEKHNRSEEVLMLLSDMFNHSNMALTRRYLGIRKQEIKNIYLSI